jgi:uncharacterized membrane protein
MERHSRSIAKTLSWRVVATFITGGIVGALTGDLTLAATAGLIDTIVKLFAFYAHERAWNRIPFGRDDPTGA